MLGIGRKVDRDARRDPVGRAVDGDGPLARQPEIDLGRSWRCGSSVPWGSNSATPSTMPVLGVRSAQISVFHRTLPNPAVSPLSTSSVSLQTEKPGNMPARAGVKSIGSDPWIASLMPASLLHGVGGM